MDVKIQTKCGRCGRLGEKVVSIDEASELLATEKQQKAALDSFLEVLKEQDNEFLPEVMILKKNGERFDVEVLDNLCEIDGKRSKGCKARVSYLIEDLMFRIKHESKPAEPLAEGEEATPKRKRRTRAEIEAARAEAASAEA